MTNFRRTEGFEVSSAETRQIQVRETVSLDMQHDAQKHLNGEAPSERAIYVDGEWFFSTREGIELGPYATRDDAASAATDLATMLKDITDPESARQFVIREFMLLRWRNSQAEVAEATRKH
jgi:uncharacterized protein DUF6316